jgi:carboxyl-terminal processing protease
VYCLPIRSLLTVLLAGVVTAVAPPSAFAQAENTRKQVELARELEASAKWEDARQIYETLLNQEDPGLRIRERYHNALRRCFQVRRHEDLSYRKEALSISYGQALNLCNMINNTLLTASVEKKKIDAVKVFRKGVEEFAAALANPNFREQYVPESRRHLIDDFRESLHKIKVNAKGMTQRDVAKLISEIAMDAELRLQLNPTVVVMEFACGACYAVDDYTVYLTPNQLSELAQNLSQTEVVSVGMFLRTRENKIVVRDMTEDSPARQMIQINDEIVSVDKVNVTSLTADRVKELINGPVGSFVEIEVLTPGLQVTRIHRVQRRAMIASVLPFMVQDTNIGVIKVTGFSNVTVQEIDAALAELSMNYGMKRLIIDLRQNSGGVFDSAVETARRFIPNGIIASEIHHDGKFKVHQAKDANALSLPTIVLVDGDTASAAEVLAGALKENGRAILIGQTTYGKGCTQDVLKLPNAPGNVPTGGMKLTISRFFSPKGIAYSGRGVIPHIFIDDRMADSEANMMGRDAYITRAVEEFDRMNMLMK